ncbi:MAG TPA: hypothetical protein VLF39_01600 [Candidatus Saccharimonadales bacterium]|nr:hypothetical protein [Candidatus Saccharimonadales bacterium]
MKVGTIVTIVVILLAAIVASFVVFRKKPRKLDINQYVAKWKKLQAFCRDKATWPMALTDADKLLDSALRRRRFKGKSMGERLVSAQRTLTNNDGIWFAHNLCKKVLIDNDVRLKEVDVKAALVAYRQALKDLGALPNGQSKEV